MRERQLSRARPAAVAGELKGDSITLPHRAEVERATGFDFRHVRAYADPEGLDRIAANAASAGDKVWFAKRDPSLVTVAHELAHTRQVGARSGASSAYRVAPFDSPLEREADAFATAVAAGSMVPALAGRSDGNTLHREPKKKTITSIDVTFQHSDGHGNGVGKATIVLHYDDGTTKTIHGDGGGKKDAKGIHPTSGGKHHVIGGGKDADHHSSVYKGPDGKPAPMKYYTPFASGEGFHKGNVDDESHGCIHLTEGDAKEIFDHAPNDTPVDIHVPKATPKKAPPAKKEPAKKEPPKKAPPKKEPPKKEPPKKEPAKKPPPKKKKPE